MKKDWVSKWGGQGEILPEPYFLVETVYAFI